MKTTLSIFLSFAYLHGFADSFAGLGMSNSLTATSAMSSMQLQATETLGIVGGGTGELHAPTTLAMECQAFSVCAPVWQVSFLLSLRFIDCSARLPIQIKP